MSRPPINLIVIAITLAILLNPIPHAHASISPSSPVGPAKLLTTRASASPQYQTPTTRQIVVEWTEDRAGQDRFYPDFIIVNQGDIVNLTFINNDTVAHDLVIGTPYNILINATVPGLYNDLTGQKFTTPATNNSPGVQVLGTPGNVSAFYSFVANYAGIFEYVCSYHVQVGMIGYFVVLSSSASTNSVAQTNTTSPTLPQNSSFTQVSIDAGSGINVNSPGYTPADITLVIGVNNTVRWVNNDNMPHTVTAVDGSFDSGNLNAGDSFVHTFNKTGTYAYVCVYHHWMHGSITVLTAQGSMQSNSELSTVYAMYGLVALGVVALIVIMVVFSKPKQRKSG